MHGGHSYREFPVPPELSGLVSLMWLQTLYAAGRTGRPRGRCERDLRAPRGGVDEITLLTYPMVIGQGTRLFPDAGPDTALDLVDSRTAGSGVTIQVYRPAGRPQYATAMPR
jgi:RibD C-terminal domain